MAINEELLAALIASRTPKTNNNAVWASLCFISILVLVAVGAFAYTGGALTALTPQQPVATPVVYPTANVSQVPAPAPALVTQPVQVAPTAAPIVVQQPVQVPAIEQAPVQPVVVDDAQVKAQAILALGRGPIATTPTPVPTGAYALAPDFAPGVMGPQQPTAKPFVISGVFK